jgi:hypothetical protein
MLEVRRHRQNDNDDLIRLYEVTYQLIHGCREVTGRVAGWAGNVGQLAGDLTPMRERIHALSDVLGRIDPTRFDQYGTIEAMVYALTAARAVQYILFERLNQVGEFSPEARSAMHDSMLQTEQQLQQRALVFRAAIGRLDGSLPSP